MSGIAVAVLLIAAGTFWWVKSSVHDGPESTPHELARVESTAPASPKPESAPAAPSTEGPTVAAATEDLANPWSAKKFIFLKPSTHENINAMVIRLPNGNLWAFALLEPFGKCELEFVTDLGQLTKKYGFQATHPMMASPCDGTIYDPLKVGPLGGATWARGEIVQGAGLRPPFSIDVQVDGPSIVADSIE